MGWLTDEFNQFPNLASYPDAAWTYRGTQTGVWNAAGDVKFTFPKPSSGLPGSTYEVPNNPDIFIELALKTWVLSAGVDDDMSIALYRAPVGQPDPSGAGVVYDQFLFDFELNGLFQQISHNRNGGAFTVIGSQPNIGAWNPGDIVRAEILKQGTNLVANLYRNGVLVVTGTLAGFTDINPSSNGWINYYGFANGSVAGSQTMDFASTKVGHHVPDAGTQPLSIQGFNLGAAVMDEPIEGDF